LLRWKTVNSLGEGNLVTRRKKRWIFLIIYGWNCV